MDVGLQTGFHSHPYPLLEERDQVRHPRCPQELGHGAPRSEMVLGMEATVA